MSTKLRSVNTKFWQDPFIEDLGPTEKLLFLYFLTNPTTNILGIYEISLKLISYHVGIDKDKIINILNKFEEAKKIYFHQNYIILINFSKNQNLNKNMFIGAVNLYEKLPEDIKKFIIQKELKGFERIQKASKGFERTQKDFKGCKTKSKQTEGEKETEVKKENEGEENTQAVYLKFDHLSITHKNHKILVDKYGSIKVENIYKKIQNYRENQKYNDLYLTAVFWLDDDIRKFKEDSVKNGLYTTYSYEQMSKMAIQDKQTMIKHKPVEFDDGVKWVSLEDIKTFNLNIKK